MNQSFVKVTLSIISFALFASCGVPIERKETRSSFGKSHRVCTEDDLQQAFSHDKEFKLRCENREIQISKTLKLHRDNFVFDGKTTLILKWAKISDCNPSSKNHRPMIEIKGSYNRILNLKIEGAPQGVFIAKGSNNLFKNVHFNRICSHCIVNGVKSPVLDVFNTRVSSVEFSNTHSTVVDVNQGSILIENSRFENVSRSIWAGNHTKVVLRKSNMRGDPSRCDSSISLSGFARLKATDNQIDGCKYAIAMRNDAISEVKNNQMSGLKKAVFTEDRAKLVQLK